MNSVGGTLPPPITATSMAEDRVAEGVVLAGEASLSLHSPQRQGEAAGIRWDEKE